MYAPYDTTAGYPRTATMPGSGFSRIINWVSARRQIGRTIRELQAYSDRELHDMGLTRSDIRAVASGKLTRG